ncbi:adenosylcobinamide-GDP ribazoletransferase [Chitinophaga rhizophila]|uniref:Adenosylcobinamide-GDP ribazoletransferase n=1 Tax=Chitinophaga rhizophila TaxID=2866212 RepID=A0ABS7GKA9_9BACT|nr:adenosylcobinamide-GDP ribazoletransferase [Chitinophaga rhizophila]MBW8687092.1 adenosylcobinamide-GDP ribazoletransferase [Chitinophaga rhizophila]
MKKEIRIFLTALMFFTRIPVPSGIDHNAADLNKSSRYFPMVGILTGIIGAAVFAGANMLFKDIFTAVILSVIATLLTTGAFHEDGLADVADGFGGGWTRQRILEIMKDSRVGAFGVIVLIMTLLLKICLLAKLALLMINTNLLPYCLLYVAAHAFSRTMPVYLLRFMAYAREDDSTAKSKPLATKISWTGFVIANITGLIPLLMLIICFHHSWWLLMVVIPCGLLTLYLCRYFRKWINGYTGDCLGATQQLNELIFYMGILAIWNFI